MSEKLLLILPLFLAFAASAQTSDELVGQAQTAYQAKEPAECARLYGLAFDQRPGTSRSFYDAACCAALADQPDLAIGYLHSAINAGYRNIDWLGQDSDLNTLRDRPEWAGVMASAEAAQQTFLASLNPALYAIYQQDQADRMTRPIDWNAVSVRDSLRRVEVGTILLAGGAVTADDLYHAAMVFQHGETPESFLLANQLVREAVRLDSTQDLARQMIAMTYDRYLWNVGRPQVYGTQFQMNAEGLWTFEPFDPTIVTDAQRIAAGSLPLAAKYEWLEGRNAQVLEQREREVHH